MSRRFKSYLYRSDVEMKEKGKATFKSYVETTEEDEGVGDESEEVEQSASTFFDSHVLKPHLLEGEKIISQAQSVLKFAPFVEKKQGISGHLFVTNFKVTFVTADKSSYELPSTKEETKRQRNKMIDENDIPLTNINGIYQYISGSKKRRMVSGNLVSGQTKYLELYCKDFQIHTFGFKFTSRDQAKSVMNALIHHTVPTRADLLFAYDFGHSLQEDTYGSGDGSGDGSVQEFTQRSDWEQEIKRQNCDTTWRVTDVNNNFFMSTSLPEYFVVPSQCLNNDLQQVAAQFPGGRLPVWCFTYRNGISLCRMSQLQQESEFKIFEVRMISAIKQSGPSKNEPEVIDLPRCCPTIRDIQLSYEKLKELCMTVSLKEFEISDLSWYGNLESTQWLIIIAKCLQTTDEVIELMVKKQTDVVLKEEKSLDISCVISSLVQICLDPFFRTLNGFQQLIQREWVAMGHPFQLRHKFVASNEMEQAPVFLIFLDCVWQLMNQFPSYFAFTETYLTTLWDSVHLGLFKTFLFDNLHQQRKFLREGRKLRHINLPSVWNWSTQFNDSDMKLFNNPLYNIKTLSIPEEGQNGVTLASPETLLRDHIYRRQLQGLYKADKPLFFKTEETIRPQYTAAMIKLWNQCYLRWNVPAEIIGGGNPSQYLQQCLLVEEIIYLQDTVLRLEKKQSRKMRPKSDLIFSYDEPQSPSFLDSTFLTSSFPFSPSASNKSAMNCPPLSSYLQYSTIEYDYTDAVE